MNADIVEYKGTKIIPTHAGWKIKLTQRMEMPGVYQTQFLAERAVDKYIGTLESKKRKTSD